MSYHQARQAVGRRGIVHAPPLNLGHLLLNSADSVPVREQSETVLRPLLDHGERSGVDLLDTLAVYLDSDCSVSRASAKLFVHRNTLRYRLNLITELTGWSPDTFEGRIHLWLAVGVLERSTPPGSRIAGGGTE